MAKAGVGAAPAGAKPHGRSTIWLEGLACGAVMAFAPAAAVLAFVLLAPAVAAALLDSRAGRPVARAVALSGLALSLAPLWHLILDGRTLEAALALLADPTVVGPAWLAGASGWALCELLPVLLRVAADMRATARTAALRAEAGALTQDWDLGA